MTAIRTSDSGVRRGTQAATLGMGLMLFAVLSQIACAQTSDSRPNADNEWCEGFSEARLLHSPLIDYPAFPGFDQHTHVPQEVSMLGSAERETLKEVISLKASQDFPISGLGLHISRDPKTGRFHVGGIAIDIGSPMEPGLGFEQSKVADQILEMLPRFPYLRYLSLQGSGPLDDEAYEQISNLHSLELLIADRSITDVQLAYIGKLPRLRVLDLQRATSVSDAGLDNMDNLDQIQHLNVWRTGVGTEGAKWLRRCESLAWISVDEHFDGELLKLLPSDCEMSE